MTLDGVLAAFSMRLHNLVKFIASIYITCVFCGMFIAGASGYKLLGKILEVLSFDSVKNWAASVSDRIEEANASGAVQTLLGIWLIVSLLFFVADYADRIQSNLSTNSAMSTAFFWSVLTDFFYEGSIWGYHTLGIFTAIGFIIYRNRKSLKECLERPMMALIALIVSPLYAIIFIPSWLASESRPSEITRSTNTVVSELKKLRVAIEKKCSSGESGKS